MNISGIGSSTTSGVGGAGQQGTSAEFDALMTLLTTQLKHQDPLQPTDTEQYTDQLVQYASVEQQMQINGKIDSLMGSLELGQNSLALGYLGNTVEVSGDTAALTPEGIDWIYELPEGASTVELSVLDEAGRLVHSQSGEASAGEHQFSWNGQKDDGEQAGDGTYRLVVEALDGRGQSVGSETRVVGTVTGVDTSSGQAMLDLGGLQVPVEHVERVRSAGRA